MLNETLKNVCVLGAAGKMGSGISLLLLQEMARLEAELTGEVGRNGFYLMLVDSNSSGLDALKPYFRDHLTRYAEKNINLLRKYFAANAQLVSNEEIVTYFVAQALDIIHCELDSSKVVNADMVFEAIVEDVAIKCATLKAIAERTGKPTYFFSNTSSIPIHILNEEGHLQNRVVGFHFYNPPAIQKLVELILPNSADSQLAALSCELAKRLHKTIVVSKDAAGFIGNGFFIREIIFACETVRELSRIYPLVEAIYIVNRVTQDFLIRPMGIFQLIDYVGIDVCKRICQIMSTYLVNELFQDPLLDSMLDDQIFGGQYADGSQKDGFFQYERLMKKGIYAPLRHEYLPLGAGHWAAALDKKLGVFPEEHTSWKQMQKNPHRQERLKTYLHHLQSDFSEGAELAKQFLMNSKKVADNLVKQGIAQCLEDVDTVLENGFFHLYGPTFLKEVIE